MADKKQILQDAYSNTIKNAENYKQTVEGCGKTVGSNIITHMKSLETLANKDPDMMDYIANQFVDNVENRLIVDLKKQRFNNNVHGASKGVEYGVLIGIVGTLVVAGAGKFIFNRIKNRKKNEDHYVEVPESHEEYAYINLSETQNENEVKEN